MYQRSYPINCCIPPHILRNIAQRGSEQQRNKAINSLITGAHFRSRREVMERSLFVTPTGTMQRSIFNCKYLKLTPGDLIRTEGGAESSDRAVNQAYDALGQTYKFYKDVFERNSIDNKGTRLIASVHYGEKYDNAFWDGGQMVFGDGDGQIFVGFTEALDVIGHELAHGVTQYESRLEYLGQSGR